MKTMMSTTSSAPTCRATLRSPGCSTSFSPAVTTSTLSSRTPSSPRARGEDGVLELRVLVVTAGENDVEHPGERSVALQVGAELVVLIIVFIGAVDRALRHRRRRDVIGAVGEALARAEIELVLQLGNPDLGLIRNRRAIAKKVGLPGVAHVYVGLSKPVVEIRARLHVRILPVDGLARANTSKLDAIVVRNAARQYRDQVVGHAEIGTRVPGPPLNVEVAICDPIRARLPVGQAHPGRKQWGGLQLRIGRRQRGLRAVLALVPIKVLVGLEVLAGHFEAEAVTEPLTGSELSVEQSGRRLRPRDEARRGRWRVIRAMVPTRDRDHRALLIER